MAELKKQRHERLALALFAGHTQAKAGEIAGYTGRSSSVCTILKKNPEVMERVRELKSLAVSLEIADFQERQKKLTEIVRGDLTDYQDEAGLITVSRKSPNRGAVSEYEVSPTRYGEKRTLRLRNPVEAIAELNKMDKVYTEVPPQDNHKEINIYVISPDTKELLGGVGAQVKKLMEGTAGE